MVVQRRFPPKVNFRKVCFGRFLKIKFDITLFSLKYIGTFNKLNILCLTFVCFFDSDSGADATMASSSNDSHYSGSRVETPVSYMGEDDDDDDEFDENDDEDWKLSPPSNLSIVHKFFQLPCPRIDQPHRSFNSSATHCFSHSPSEKGIEEYRLY